MGSLFDDPEALFRTPPHLFVGRRFQCCPEQFHGVLPGGVQGTRRALAHLKGAITELADEGSEAFALLGRGSAVQEELEETRSVGREPCCPEQLLVLLAVFSWRHIGL